MLKFLRKYNKWILVFGGTLLMIAFLAPQAIQNLPKIRNKTVAQYDGAPVKSAAMQDANSELRAISALMGSGPLANIVLGLTAPSNEQDIEWYMLTREAEEAGYIGSDGDGRSVYPLIAQRLAAFQADQFIQQNPQLSSLRPQLINSYIPDWQQRILSSESSAAGAGNYRTLQDLQKAFAKLHGVLRMRLAHDAVAKYSLSRATRAGSQTFDSADIDYLVIPAERFTDSVSEPTEEQITAHFAKYADEIAGETEFGIGYRQPQQIKLEWIALERTPIEDAITIDPVDASKYQQLNPELFPSSFTEELANIQAVLKQDQAGKIIEQAENFIRAELLRATRTLERDGDYISLPDDWATTRPSLETLAQIVVDKIADSNDGLIIPLPTIVRRTDKWLSFQDIYSLDGIGFSQLQLGSQSIPINGALFRVQELNPTPDLPVQVGLLASEYPTTGNDGSQYFFRVLSSRDISAPDSIEEIREQVITDLKRIEAYKQVVSELAGYAEVAINASLEDVENAVNAGLPEANEETEEEQPQRVAITQGEIRSEAGRSTPFIFRDEPVLTAAFDLTKPLDPTLNIEDIPLANRTFSVAAPKSLSVVIGRISKLKPLTQEDFAMAYEQLSLGLIQREIANLESFDNPFSYENLRERHNFISLSGRTITGESDEDDENAEGSDDETTESQTGE